MSPSIWQILIVVALVFLLFGAGRLPRVMEDIAKGIKSFKKGIGDEETKPEALEKNKPEDKKD
ncbi:MAG: twin-arginine translocase TatA/TatE family subunit [Rhodospirillales bacterium]|nr:twin-arginine translocase TatA/TatE family subunit [Alphaproteobacteria bacterium]USO04490.1 MAG: twin-arginine translocase TatA/TatE family subunit [Rhodospirillales bacterium]